ncbi:MAG: BatD family protein [Parvibaculaceae bacterium]|nr:BatD family protein [Parvibaculaceae bacterium]
MIRAGRIKSDRGKWTCIGSLLFLFLVVSPAQATQGLGPLVREDRLRVTMHIPQAQRPLYVTQPVTVYVEIATQGRFNGGTRIRGLQVSDAIALPPPAFAVNATRSEGGKLWAVQTWSLTLYPLKEKEYLVPSLSLDVKLVDKGGIERRGILKTKPQAFEALLPPGAASKEPWFAAENVTVTSTLKGPAEGLEKGAAVIRTIEVDAEGVPGMMLEELSSESIPGLAAYSDAPEVGTTSNRGSRLGWRRQRTTYIIQKPGRFLLPEYTLNWWSIGAGQWEKTTTPRQIIQTKGISASAPLIKATVRATGRQKIYGSWVWWFVGASLLGALGIYLPAATMCRGKQLPYMAQWNARRHARNALSRGKVLLTIRLFYQWYDQYGDNKKTPSVRAEADSAEFEALMERGFSNYPEEHNSIQTDAIFESVGRLKAHKPGQSKPFSLND